MLYSVLGIAQSKNEQSIQGKFLLDSTLWKPVAYLSHIPSFDKMYTISNEIIIAESPIDREGNFEFSTTFFPEEEQLYRLHFVKKGTPSTSLIIGGPEENHFFVIASSKKGVYLEGFSKYSPFAGIAIARSPSTILIKEIDVMISYTDSIYNDGVNLKRSFIAAGVQERLRNLADTLSQPLPSLYALYKSDYKKQVNNYPSFYNRYLDKWKDQKSSYFQELRKEIPRTNKPWILYVILALVFFGLGVIMSKKLLFVNNKTSKKLKALSIQERKIFELLKSGHSNKEISETYNIGLSTVKSHVSTIYSKLDIKSRKEAMDY